MEIERKWLLRGLPKILKSETPDLEVLQAYLSIKNYPGEIRVRETVNPHDGEMKWYLTFKSLGTLSREEHEVAVPKWLFDSLASTTTKRLLKTISFINYAKFKLEFHVYTSATLIGLIVMECEFENEHDAEFFEPPEWLDIIKEVTDDPKYRNSNLASKGLPK